jgi:hypothetical protein
MTSKLDLQAIRKRAEAATEGPWEVAGGHRDRVYAKRECLSIAYDLFEEDAEFIAHAITDVPALIAEVERLRAELETRTDMVEYVFGERIEENAKQYADTIRKRFAEQEEFEWRKNTTKRK